MTPLNPAMTPGNHLRALRTRALLSQQQLANISGCSLRSLSRAENDYPVSELNKARLAATLRVDVKDIWPGAVGARLQEVVV